MSAITFRLPDAKYERLKQLAKSQNISVNKLLDELSTVALASYDAKTSFEIRAKKGDKSRGLDILDKLQS
jgi:predicted DNA-binding ribbon-helix-helix protein